ncbi:MAG: F0F1 ATP synthase subunit C [Planctomycetes bacterium]|nr:F0F1 ATP synthase subunit C [Planctomycetota bacterium]
MTDATLLSLASIITAGLTISIGSIAPALGESRGLVAALDAIARQPDAASTTTRTLFVGLAMVESTAIYCLVVALILLFANPLIPAA